MKIRFPEDTSEQSIISIQYKVYFVPEFGRPYAATRERIIRIRYNRGGSYNASFGNVGTYTSAELTGASKAQIRTYIAKKIIAIRSNDVYAQTIKVSQIA